MKEQKEIKEGYVNNAELKKLISRYNELNIDDTGEWISRYITKMNKKEDLKSITDEKFELSIDFIKNKRKQLNELHDKYSKMTDAEKICLQDELTAIRNLLFMHFNNIIDGRINSLRIKAKINDLGEIHDIAYNALLAIFKYINRFDATRCTSAFSYVTQMANNSIIHDLNQWQDRKERMVTGLDYFENINTEDDPSDMKNNTFDKFIQ